MMKTFAKLFDRPGFGQVLAKLDVSDDDGNPELRWYVQPPDLGVCSFALGFTDDDAGWDLAEKAFNEAREEQADAAGRALFNACGLTRAQSTPQPADVRADQPLT